MIFHLDIDQKKRRINVNTAFFWSLKMKAAIGGPLKDLSAALFNN